MSIIAELSPAKLNLALSVGPADAESGMHPICSWMVTVDIYDELQVQTLPAGSLSRYAIMWHNDVRRRSDINWSIAKDLAVRAHLAVEKHVGRSLPLQLKLEKRIPVGGGLGGGSSNAAAMLRAVNRLYELKLPAEKLVQIGASLGSDVPFFIEGGSAIVAGLGEKIAPHDAVPDLHATIVFPDVQCPTPAVYQTFDTLTNGSIALRAEDVASLPIASPGRPLAGALFNDLSEAALTVAPALRQYSQDIAVIAERPVHLTGSGSCLFILCDNSPHAAALAETIEQRLNLPAVAVRMHSHAHETIAR